MTRSRHGTAWLSGVTTGMAKKRKKRAPIEPTTAVAIEKEARATGESVGDVRDSHLAGKRGLKTPTSRDLFAGAIASAGDTKRLVKPK